MKHATFLLLATSITFASSFQNLPNLRRLTGRSTRKDTESAAGIETEEAHKLPTKSAIVTTLAAVSLCFGVGVDQMYEAISLTFGVQAVEAATESTSDLNFATAPPAVTTQSSDRAIAVAKALNAKEAKMYGAYWCSHCFGQKQLLGQQAMKYVKYVECAKDGVDSQRKTCLANGIPGYPTWQVDGNLYAGEMTLAQLEDIVQGKIEPDTPVRQ